MKPPSYIELDQRSFSILDQAIKKVVSQAKQTEMYSEELRDDIDNLNLVWAQICGDIYTCGCCGAHYVNEDNAARCCEEDKPC